MTAVTTAGLDQLGDLTGDAAVLPVDIARTLARQARAEAASADIHDHHAMLGAAVTLDMRLASLLAALDAEEVVR
ncbi:hypothetical protein [Streptomyces sp. S1]|uniref:hypothetical protein n=1 Tax=Streptomyces sp. S1 TaxID=718288 RepID=UPI003D75A538